MSAAEKDINTALSVRLQAIQSEGLPAIAYENAAFTPTTGTLYLRENFLPNIKDPVGIAHSGADDYEGLYQVTVLSARGERRFEGQEQARLVSAHFPRGAEYTYNSIRVKVTSSRVGSPVQIEDRYSVPVTIEWRAIV